MCQNTRGWILNKKDKLAVFLDPVWNRPTPASPALLDEDDSSWWPVTRTTDSNSRLFPTELLPAKYKSQLSPHVFLKYGFWLNLS